MVNKAVSTIVRVWRECMSEAEQGPCRKSNSKEAAFLLPIYQHHTFGLSERGYQEELDK